MSMKRDMCPLFGLPHEHGIGEGYECRDTELLNSIRECVKRKRYAGIKLQCFNRDDVEWFRSRLTPEELRFVHFTWMEFK